MKGTAYAAARFRRGASRAAMPGEAAARR